MPSRQTEPFTTSLPCPLEDEWGFVGTLRQGVELTPDGESRVGLNDEQLCSAWQAGVVAVARESGCSEQRAADFLRSRWGRHLADEVCNQYEGELLDALLLAVQRKNPKGKSWWAELVADEKSWQPFTLPER